DLLQHAHRRIQADRRARDLRRAGHHREAAARRHGARDRADVPEHPPVPGHDVAGERARRDALAAAWRLRRQHPRDAARAARGGRRRGAGARAPPLLRPPGPRRRLRAQPPVRRPAPAGGRPGARDAAEAAAARRADGGDEPPGVGRLHRVRAGAAPRARADGAADRARHARRHGPLRPDHGARLRREDRRGRSGGGPEGPARDRGVPREGGSGLSEAQANGAVLELENVHTYYGAIHAIKGVTLEVREGEIVTLLGANGAGKSTTLRSINGLNHPRRGRIRFQGEDITYAPPHEIVARGVAQSPEGRKLFPRMTVLENLEMGAFQRKDKSGLKEDLDRVFTLFPRLAERKSQKAGTMSGGEQQMCAIGRALMAHPKLLLL